MEPLIAAVRKYPCLWNTAAIEYRDQELKDAAWAEVMKESSLSSVKEVKLKWKKLRDSYRDALKRQSDMMLREGGACGAGAGAGAGAAPGAGGAGGSKRFTAWKYMHHMHFLQPHMSNRKKVTESSPPGPQGSSQQTAPTENGQSQNGADADGSSDDSSSDDSSPKRKTCSQLTVIDRKLDYLCKAQSKRPCSETDRRVMPPSAPDPLDIFFNSMCQSTKRLPYHTQIKIKKVLFSAVVEAEEAVLAEQASYASLWAAGAPSSSSSDQEDDQKTS